MPIVEFRPNTSAPPFSEARLRTVESELGQQLPGDFVESLTRANGGVPSDRYIEIGGQERQVDRFLSILDDYKDHPLGMYDIEVVWSQIEDRLGENLLPIAALSNGDFLCLSYEPEEETPCVVLWDHERSLTDAPVFKFVADSYSDLARHLHK